MRCRIAVFAGLMMVAGVAIAATDVDRYLEYTRDRESAGDYGATTSLGSATGAYQFTAAALEDLGLISTPGGKGQVGQSGAGEWANATWNDNPWGISSRADFLASREAQDAAMAAYTERNWRYLSSGAKSTIGQTVNGMVVDEASLLAGAHFLGAGGMNEFASCGFAAHCISERAASANNMTREQLAGHIHSRMAQYNGLDVSEMTDGQYTPPPHAPGAPTQVADPGPAVSAPGRATRVPELPPLQGRRGTLL